MRVVTITFFDIGERVDMVAVYLESERGEREFIGQENMRNELALYKIIAAAQYKMKGLDSNGKSKSSIV